MIVISHGLGFMHLPMASAACLLGARSRPGCWPAGQKGRCVWASQGHCTLISSHPDSGLLCWLRLHPRPILGGPTEA